MITSALALIVGIVIHESAHALAAYLLGDRTARDRGRISFNPMAHIDPFGTILLPLIMILAGGPVFAFAKPVPVYLGNLKHPKRDELIVSFAGPVANILLAILGAVLARFIIVGGGIDAVVYNNSVWNYLSNFAFSFIAVNLSLAFFNLIPLPPLDGSSILVPFLKGKALARYYEIQRYSMPILMVVLYILPSLLHIDLLEIYFNFTVYPLYGTLVSFALAM